ncbi:hypothetical protein Tco_0924769 [Tanacetum coccineum]|uniref:Uncharacterized protein n=1 Tax=Tanacetum coccineum TaxID=301880 RepID=A0ABQ5D4Y4_9ASTR
MIETGDEYSIPLGNARIAWHCTISAFQQLKSCFLVITPNKTDLLPGCLDNSFIAEGANRYGTRANRCSTRKNPINLKTPLVESRKTWQVFRNTSGKVLNYCLITTIAFVVLHPWTFLLKVPLNSALKTSRFLTRFGALLVVKVVGISHTPTVTGDVTIFTVAF